MATWNKIQEALPFLATDSRKWMNRIGNVLQRLGEKLDKDNLQIFFVLLFSVVGLGAVYYVNHELGYRPEWGKALRNMIMIAAIVPYTILLRKLKYKGRMRLLILATALLALGMTMRYDYETKRNFNSYVVALENGDEPSEYHFGNRADIVAFGKFFLAYGAHFVIFLMHRKRPDKLRQRYTLLAVLATFILVGYGIYSLAADEQFLFGMTPWDIATPLLVVVIAGYLADDSGTGLGRFSYKQIINDNGKTRTIYKIGFPREIYWVPLVVLWAFPALAFVMIREFGIFMILGMFLILMLFLATKRWEYLVLSTAVIAFFGWIVIHFDLVGGHIGVRLSLWTDFWRYYPESIPSGQLLMENVDFQNWVGEMYRRGQHLSGFFAIYHGGFTGVGPGVGYPNAIPLATTDFLTPALVETFGLFGLLSVLGLVISYSRHCFSLAETTTELPYLEYVLQGFGVLIIIQTFISIAGTLALMPMTGVPVPYLARSNMILLASMASMGYVMAIENYLVNKKQEPQYT